MKFIKGWIALGILIVIIAPFLLTREAFIKQLDFTSTGGIGDTIGGVTAPVVQSLQPIEVQASVRFRSVRY